MNEQPVVTNKKCLSDKKKKKNYIEWIEMSFCEVRSTFICVGLIETRSWKKEKWENFILIFKNK
jgi:hypothetical protein